MNDQKILGLGLVIIIAMVLAGIAKLIQRGRAKPGVIAILLLFPFLFIYGIHLMEGGIPPSYSNLSNELIIGVIASLIAGIILFGLKKK